MSGTAFTKPLITILGGKYDGVRQLLILNCEREGRTFPLKIDLKLAGSGIWCYHVSEGTLNLMRGRKDKLKTEGETFRDFTARVLGVFTCTRPIAAWLLSVTGWKGEQDLTGWPEPRALLTGVKVTRRKITFSFARHLPLSVFKNEAEIGLFSGAASRNPSPVKQVSIATGGSRYLVDVDTETGEGRAALAALGYPEYGVHLLTAAEVTAETITLSLSSGQPLVYPRGRTAFQLDARDLDVPAPRLRELTVSVDGVPTYYVWVDTHSAAGAQTLAALGYGKPRAAQEGVLPAEHDHVASAAD